MVHFAVDDGVVRMGSELRGKGPWFAQDEALNKVTRSFLMDDTEVYKQFVQNESFKRFVTAKVFALTNQ